VSGNPAQFNMISGIRLRAPPAWINRATISLPLPLSPVISTDISVGATCMATLTALFSRGELPIIPNRCLTVCISKSETAIFLGIQKLPANCFAYQRTTRAFFNKYIDILTFLKILLRKNNHLIVSVPALKKLFRPFRNAFD
jgi:hypothetical protein